MKPERECGGPARPGHAVAKRPLAIGLSILWATASFAQTTPPKPAVNFPAQPPLVDYWVCTAVQNTGAAPFQMHFDQNGFMMVDVQRLGANVLVNVGGLNPAALAQITKACTGH